MGFYNFSFLDTKPINHTWRITMRTLNRWAGIGVGAVMGVVLLGAVVMAGNLEPSGGLTEAGSQMYTLDQIYHRINNGTTANKMPTFTEPDSGPTSGTMHTLNEIYDLVGVRAPVPKTGQTLTAQNNLAMPGYDNVLQKGTAWPVPRFTDNNNGTVTDNLTGLIWLKDANCFGIKGWPAALSSADALTAGYCGLTDGSKAGDWRLPNVRELQSLVHYAYYNPALPNRNGSGQWKTGDPFTNVQSKVYWSSSFVVFFGGEAWGVDMWGGSVSNYFTGIDFNNYVWPVRSGQ
jgi:hypothetical protein